MTNRVLAQLDAWRKDLINLNRNNRLLYFRKTRSSTLEVLQPRTTDLLSRLSGSSGITIWEPPEGEDSAEKESMKPEAEQRLGVAFVPGQHTGDRNQWYQSTIPPGQIVCDVRNREQLRRTLKWLERRTAQEFMDRGLWILYLGIGIVDWIDQPMGTGEAQSASSPVYLVPVSLHRDSAQSPYRLRKVDEDAAINPALAFKFQHDFGIVLPSLEDNDDEDIDALLETVRDLIAPQAGWTLSDRVVLSVFSFHKEAIYRDLQNNEVTVAAHPIVQALALGHRSEAHLDFREVSEDELDEAHPPESVLTILDADASQRQCLAAAALGHSFVLEGPPGTGKSQTIANVIGDALARGKTVLFVSEKAAALEVVYGRLAWKIHERAVATARSATRGRSRERRGARHLDEASNRSTQRLVTVERAGWTWWSGPRPCRH